MDSDIGKYIIMLKTLMNVSPGKIVSKRLLAGEGRMLSITRSYTFIFVYLAIQNRL